MTKGQVYEKATIVDICQTDLTDSYEEGGEDIKSKSCLSNSSRSYEPFRNIIEHENSIYFRRLNPADIDRVKELCATWFPINYPDHWYEEITRLCKYYSVAAIDTLSHSIVGLIVAECKRQSQCNREDRGLVSTSCGSNDPLVAYILSLGVISERRRQGIASTLLKLLIEHLTSPGASGGQSFCTSCPSSSSSRRKKRRRRKSSSSPLCQAVFLHVLSQNVDAIHFYQSQGFHKFQDLPNYYFIDGHYHDGMSYVKYVNGGRPPLTIDSITQSLNSCCRTINESCHQIFRSLPSNLPAVIWGLLRSYKSCALRVWRPLGYLLLKITSSKSNSTSTSTTNLINNSTKVQNGTPSNFGVKYDSLSQSV